MAGARDDADEDDGEWRYSLSDLEDPDEDDTAGEAADGDSQSGEGVAGTFSPSKTIEPGEIDPENAAFVLLGVLIAGAAAASYVSLLL